jgi:hypothetical protein
VPDGINCCNEYGYSQTGGENHLDSVLNSGRFDAMATTAVKQILVPIGGFTMTLRS